MADTKPRVAGKPQEQNNLISWLAPIICIVVGYIIWRFVLGNPNGFKEPGEGFFWPTHKGPKDALSRVYEGGIIVPFLIGLFLMVVAFSIERYLTIKKALGAGKVSEFVKNVQFHLSSRNIDAALAACDKQQGSVGNVMKAGLKKYKEMTTETGMDSDQ